MEENKDLDKKILFSESAKKFFDLLGKEDEVKNAWMNANNAKRGYNFTIIDMTDNKYFTPPIEDIRVGYECEVAYLHEDNWTSVKCRHQEETRDFILAVLDHNRRLRVPYLTKEQIEAEGWIEAELGFFQKDIDEKSYYSLRLNSDNQIVITKSFIDGWAWVWHPFFSGECKDINTFRYICKLLNI